MADSGVRISQEALDEFSKMKIRSHIGWLMLRIEGAEVIVDSTGPPCEAPYQAGFEGFVGTSLKDTQAAFVIYDVKKEGEARGKLALIAWIPDKSPVRSRMTYAATKEEIKTKCEGCIAVQANDKSDLGWDDLVSKTWSKGP